MWNGLSDTVWVTPEQEAPLLSGQSASYGPPTDTQRVAVVQAPGGRCESDATAGEVQGPDLTGPRTCGCTLGMYNILVSVAVLQRLLAVLLNALRCAAGR